MHADPIKSPTAELDEDNKLVRLCQACGEPAVFQAYDSGAPDLIDGHYTRNCEHLDQYVCSFQSGPFGLVVPDQSQSIIWQFQTGGLLCNTRNIRGHYIPLTRPTEFEDNVDKRKIPNPDNEGPLYSLLSKVATRNYEVNTSSPLEDESYYSEVQDNPDGSLEYLWSLIDEELPFTYDPADAPAGYPPTEEAWKWIRITGLTRSLHETPGADKLIAGTDVTPLVGERVVLVYPNSD